MTPRLIGYCRVSTDEQTTHPQEIALREAGCGYLLHEVGSGADPSRPELAKLLREIGRGDTLVVVALDRVARSLSHLLKVIEHIEGRGAFFKSLRDPIDTSSPTGRFLLQITGAFAELERRIISERTKAGLRAAVASGKKLGNPGIREGRAAAINIIRRVKLDAYEETIKETAPQWLPIVVKLRPAHSWNDITRALNVEGITALDKESKWSEAALRRACYTAIRLRLAPSYLTKRKPSLAASGLQVTNAALRKAIAA